MELDTVTLEQAFQEAIAETLRTVASLEAAPARRAGAPEPGLTVFLTRLPIYRPLRATVGLIVPRELAARFAGGMLGRTVDPEQDEFDLRDTLAGILFSVAGRLLTRLQSSAEPYQLGLPECHLVPDLVGSGTFDPARAIPFAVAGNLFWGLWED